MIIAIVSKINSRIIGGDATNIGLETEIIYIGTTAPDKALIGENNNAVVGINLTGVTTLLALNNAIAAAARTFATNSGFTVPANNVLVQTYQTA